SHKFANIQRTKIGSPYVIAAFSELAKQFDSVAGFEANGGFLLASDLQINGKELNALPTRDAVLPALMLLIASRNSTISQLVNNLPQRFTWSDRVKNFPSESSQKIIKNAISSPNNFFNKLGYESLSCSTIDETDGARFILTNGDIIHLRPSGNAPELRCYAEGSDENQAKQYVTNVLGNIISLIS
ncbi:TPA: phosphomannomutase, partial [Escherichia coli]|nr:phosphomannomutase [Escherichia coli]